MNAHLEAQLQSALADNGFDPPQFQWLRTFHALLAAQAVPFNAFDLLDAACKQPSLFSQRPETLADNVSHSAHLLGLDTGAFTAAACKQPSLFYQRPETLADNVSRSASLLGLDTGTFTAAACKQPSLFYQRPETLADNVSHSARLLGLDTGTFTAAACKQPSLFYQRPETLASKLPYLTAIAEAQGHSLTAEHIITKQPAGFCYSRNHLHLRYILSRTGHLTALSSALVMPARKAEAIAISHFAGKTRTLQVMHAKGLISTLPEGIQPIDPSR